MRENDLYALSVEAVEGGTPLNEDALKYVLKGIHKRQYRIATWAISTFCPGDILAVYSANNVSFNLHGNGRVTTHIVEITPYSFFIFEN
jgi:hypothetical protein